MAKQADIKEKVLAAKELFKALDLLVSTQTIGEDEENGLLRAVDRICPQVVDLAYESE